MRRRQGPSYSKVAGNTILPMTFVVLDPKNAGQVLQAGVNVQCYGISTAKHRLPASSGVDDGNAAIAGENIKIHGPPQQNVLLSMNAPCALGAYLKSTLGGLGTPTTAAGDIANAIAQELCPGPGNNIHVEVIWPKTIS